MALSHDHNHTIMDRLGDHNRDVGLLLVRIILSGILIIKGYRFLFHSGELTNLLNSYHQTPLATTLAWIVICANIIGGVLIFIGVLTRLICAIQIPILVGAMVLNIQVHVPNSSAEWLLAFVTFLLIVYLYIYGSGKYSVGYFFLKAPKESSTMGEEDS